MEVVKDGSPVDFQVILCTDRHKNPPHANSTKNIISLAEGIKCGVALTNNAGLENKSTRTTINQNNKSGPYVFQPKRAMS